MTAPEDERNTYEPLGSGSFGSVTYRPGDIVGESYVLTSIVAKGGMGVVFRARHLQLDKVFALKLLTPLQATDANWRRFELEAKTLAKLEHKNVVQIFNMGVDSRGCPYYVMELLHGQSMAEALEGGVTLSVPQFVQSFSDICSALKLAHSKGIVHRDIKPSNLILLDSNTAVKRTKVVDFGIARLLGVEGQSAQNLTLPGEIFGSPLYMSPEQTLGLPVTFASDIYSLGCTMFEAFTGRPPFRGPTALATMMMHQTDAMPTISHDTCSGEQFDTIVYIIATCMEKDESDRFSSVGDIYDLLNSPSGDYRLRESPSKDSSSYSQYRSVKSIAPDSRAFNPRAVGSRAGLSSREGPVAERLPADTGEETSGRVARNSRNVAYVSVGALLLAFVVVAALFSIFSSRKKVKVVMPSNSDLTRHFTGQRLLPPLEDSMKPSDSFVHDTKPVSWLVNHRGKTWREFQFPYGEPVGSILIGGFNKEPATGHMIRRDSLPVDFDASDFIASVPQFYRRFDDKAVRSLLVKDSHKPPSISVLAAWHNLVSLSFDGCKFEDLYLRDLGKLKHLKDLSFMNCHISADSLAASGVLRQLKSLFLTNVDQVAKILKAVEGSKTITSLSVRRVNLNEQEVTSITTLSKLEDLDLRTTRLPNSAMKIVSRLPNLRNLLLNDARFDIQSLKELAGCKTLVRINLEKERLPPELEVQMRHACPHVTIYVEQD